MSERLLRAAEGQTIEGFQRDRRRSTALLAALTCPVLLPSPANAEPATATVVVWTAPKIAALALAAVSLAADFVSRRKEKKWRRQVSAALGRIELRLDLILQSIAALRIAFNEDMNRRYLYEREAFFTQVRQRVNVLYQKPDLSAAELQELENRIRMQDSGLLDSVGILSRVRDAQGTPLYAAFPTAAQGLATLTLASSMIDTIGPSDVRPVARTFIDELLRPCIDPKSLGSYAAQIPLAEERLAESAQWLSGAIGRVWAASYQLGGAARWTVRFSGTPDTGYTYVISRGVPAPQFPGVPQRPGGLPAATPAAEAMLSRINVKKQAYLDTKARIADLRKTVESIEKMISRVQRIA